MRRSPLRAGAPLLARGGIFISRASAVDYLHLLFVVQSEAVSTWENVPQIELATLRLASPCTHPFSPHFLSSPALRSRCAAPASCSSRLPCGRPGPISREPAASTRS